MQVCCNTSLKAILHMAASSPCSSPHSCLDCFWISVPVRGQEGDTLDVWMDSTVRFFTCPKRFNLIQEVHKGRQVWAKVRGISHGWFCLRYVYMPLWHLKWKIENDVSSRTRIISSWQLLSSISHFKDAKLNRINRCCSHIWDRVGI